MSTCSLKTVQMIPVSLKEAWSYFSDAGNLQAITPPGMGFTILSGQAAATLYPGQIIEYQVRPLWGIPVYWMTEITQVREMVFFIDDQRIGPYRLWHHQHHFREVEGGVEMTDWVHYRMPFGFIGDLVNRLFVEKKIRQIFQFRFEKIKEVFGKWPQERGYSIEFRRSG
jgi:ligand-binding SRPBCC domain-containing protein